MQPETIQTPTLITPIKQLPKQRHFLAVFFLSYMWGTFGVDRFYLGKIWTGLLKLVTFGGFGFWVLIDLIVIMTGTVKDKQGRETLQAAEYKKFTHKLVLISAIVLGALLLINGLALIAGAYQLITMIQDGNLTQIPGLETLVPGANSGLSPEELQQLGL